MNWPTVRLGDLGQWIGGGTPSKSRAEYWSGGTVPWLSPKDMRSPVLSGTQDRITEAAVRDSAVRLVPAGSVAVVLRSGILERTLPVAVVPFATTMNQDMKALSPGTGVDVRWVAWALRSIEQRVLRGARKAGATVASIEATRLMEQRIPLPDEGEQRRIVAILEEHLSDLDDASRLLNDVVSRLRRLATAALWRSTHGLDGGQRLRLDEIAEVRLGRQRSPKNHDGPSMRPYLRAANVGWDRLRLDDVSEMNFTAAEEEIYRLVPGDILLAEASGSPAEVGKSVLYTGNPSNLCFQNTLLRVRCHTAQPEFVQKYLLAEARAGRFMPESRGVGINHLGRARLAGITLDLPNETVQRKAAQHANELLDQFSRTEQGVQNQLSRAASLRRAILAATFSGRLTGHGSDTDVISELAEEESA